MQDISPAILSGQKGPYSPKTPEGWGKNANLRFKEFNTAPIDEWNPRFEIHYSKPDNFLVRKIKELFGKQPGFNFKSLLGYAEEDMKGEETRVRFKPELAPADTDNDGNISVVEDAAFVIFQDMLDEHQNITEAGALNIKAEDADGKITDLGYINSMGLLLGKSGDTTKSILSDIRKHFELDKKIGN